MLICFMLAFIFLYLNTLIIQPLFLIFNSDRLQFMHAGHDSNLHGPLKQGRLRSMNICIFCAVLFGALFRC